MEIMYSRAQTQFHTKELTPAHVYVSVNDFSTILSDMEKGLLPTGTMKPFPVEFEEEKNEVSRMNGNMSPWAMQQTDLMYEQTPVYPEQLFGAGTGY